MLPGCNRGWSCWGRATNLWGLPRRTDQYVYWIRWGSFWRSWFYNGFKLSWSGRTVSQKTSSDSEKAGPLWTLSNLWLTSPQMQGKELVSEKDSSRWPALIYAMRSIPRGIEGICIEAVMRKKVPNYLLRMIDDYPSDRWVIYEGDKWSLNEEMTCGAPQGSRVGPLVWNIMYDNFLRMELPSGTSITGFADDALVMCAADDVGILEQRINESLWRVKR